MIARRVATVVIVLALAAGLVFAVARLISVADTSVSRAALPEGWLLIRPPHEVSALAVQGDIVWAGGRDGLYAIDRHTGKLMPLPAGAPRMSYVKDLVVASDDTLWVAHSRGISRLVRGNWRDCGGGVPESPCMSVYEDRDGVMWVGTDSGLLRRDAGGWARLLGDPLAATTVEVIFQDRDGAMWFGSSHPTLGALAYFDGERWEVFGPDDGLPHGSVNDVMQDRDGTIWVGTGFARRGGAAWLDEDGWHPLTMDDGLAGEKVRSIFEDERGRLWFASEYDGVAIRDGASWRILTALEGLAGREVKDAAADGGGVLWLGTENGISRIARLP